MTPDLRQLLDEAVPEPHRHLDPDRVLHAARRRRTRSRLLAAAAVAVIAIAAPLLIWQTNQHKETLGPARVPLRLSALEHRTPLGVTGAGALAQTPLAHPGEGSLVSTLGGYELWLVEAQQDQLCLLAVRETYGAAVSNCGSRRQLLTTGLTLATSELRDTDRLVLLVAVPDGYTTATAAGLVATVSGNLAVLTFDHTPLGELAVSGRSRPTVRFPIGDFVGPGVSKKRAGEAAPADRTAAARLALLRLGHFADRYAREHGSTVGFVDALPAGERRRLRAQLRSLTDTRAVAQVGGRCLTNDLRTAAITEAPC